jgi:NADPH:quinone reductase-like Zn-dependent oxidoreductase
VIVGSEVRGRWLGGFDRNLRAVALSRLVSQRLRMLGSKPRQEDLQTLGELIEAGKLTPVIDRTYPLREVPQAIRYLVEGHGGGGKVVITV